MCCPWLKAIRWGFILSVCLCWAVGPGRAAPPSAAKGPPVKDDAASARDALALAARIDQFVAARWAANKVLPASPADDAQFLRRVYLDLAGRIPSVAEARAFLADKRLDRRQRLVDRLLDGPAYIKHSANVWRALLVPEADFQARFTQPIMEAWLRKQFAANAGYDKLVRELLTASVGNDRGFNPYGGDGGPTPVAFYSNKEYKPENIGAATARLFLGVKLECAQCHNHPFAHWTRQQFWEFSAFFAGFDVQMQMGFVTGLREIKDRREIAISGGSKVVQASFLDGTEPKWKYNVGSRQLLAEWVTSPKNPFFARAGANRMWATFFGTGLVEPVDDLRAENPPSHPELLDELASQFAAHQFDFKFLIRAITASRAYQLSSDRSHPSQDSPRLFARMALKGLTPEQLFDSLALATGFREKVSDRRFILERETMREQFLNQFASQDKRTEFQTSILQSLMLMNGKFMEEVTSPGRSATLTAIADSPFLDTRQKIEALFLAALARSPRSDEAERVMRYVKEGGAKGDVKSALGDVFWVLLNSPEFLLNH
jgi:hypothetical protein